MKRLYVLCGAMGVGKSATARALRDRLPDCALLDGDWCWDMHPFCVTETTKRVVLDNICYVLNNFLTCGAFENVVFCWVMHRREILDGILARLRTQGWAVHVVALICTREALAARHAVDVATGRRDAGNLERAFAYLPLYTEMGLPLCDVSVCTPAEAAARIAVMAPHNPKAKN